MRTSVLSLLLFSLTLLTHAQALQSAAPSRAQSPMVPTRKPRETAAPHLRDNVLWVDGHPILLRAGELGNSSASNLAYMQPIWPKLVDMHLNTLLAPVYWDLLEPQEDHFDFTLVDGLIAKARENHLKLVFLWFGTWKNSMSCYAPAWVKTNQDRYPRARDSAGHPQEIVTPFSKNALNADKKAFVALMRHLKAIDETKHTVLMIQVENEIGMLPEARDHCKEAEDTFHTPVPQKLTDYLAAHRQTLAPELKERWETQGAKTEGLWETLFGKSPATDELFMAWYFADYANEIAKAGKAVYAIPMYVNAALNAPGKKPGQYPSAGPLPHVIDIWKAAAPDIDILAPDFYNPNFTYWANRYTRPDNPLFIPEHRFESGAEAKAFYAFGHYQAIGFSPFSIESTDTPAKEPIGKCYDLIAQLSGEIAKAKEKGWLDGVLLSKEKDTTTFNMGDYIITAAHELKLGWSPKAKEDQWPLTGGIIIGLTKDEYYVAGTGIVLTFEPTTPGTRAGILSVEEGRFVDGKWQPGRRLNGDQDHQGRHLRIPVGEYSIHRIRLYTYR
jgi:beta-galactosidase GanA